MAQAHPLDRERDCAAGLNVCFRPVADTSSTDTITPMTSAVHSWKQAGRVFVWRYPTHKKKHRGWHFTCDDKACDSLTLLVRAMQAEIEPSRRSITLSPATSDVWRVPNFGEPSRESRETMVLQYDPNFGDLLLNEQDDRLRLHFGYGTASKLLEAIADVKAGRGDYQLLSSEEGVPPIWIWWMLRTVQ